MHYVNLGHSGLVVSRLALGCMSFGGAESSRQPWSLGEADSRAVIRRALEAGINFFDTANMYSDGASEEITGRALADFARRDEIVLATKAYLPWGKAPNTRGLSRKSLFQAIDDSLARLRTDYVDLLQIHRWDDAVPIAETMEALHDIVKSGKARYIGASSMAAWQFAKAQFVAERHGWTRFVSMQPQVNLLYREEEREMIPFCIDQGVAVIPWSPLARGLLARDWEAQTSRSETDRFRHHLYDASAEQDRRIVEVVGEIATRRGISRAEVALAWLLQRPGITAPIVGVTRMVHLEQAIAALAVQLEAADIEQLEAPYVPHRVVGVAVPAMPVETVSLLQPGS